MDLEINIFLPFWWIAKHPPQGLWSSEEIRFNSTSCGEKCTKYEYNDCLLTLDDLVALDPMAHIVSYISVAGASQDPLKQVPS